MQLKLFGLLSKFNAKSLLTLVVITCVFYEVNSLNSRLFAVSSKARIIVSHDMYFGNIHYNKIPSYFKINSSNLIEELYSGDIYDAGAALATITIYGHPHERVKLSFIQSDLSSDDQNEMILNVSQVGIIGGNKTLILGANGQSTVNIFGTIYIDNNNIKGKFVGELMVLAHYEKHSANLSVRVPIFANIMNEASIKVNKSLKFGTVNVASSCSVTVNAPQQPAPAVTTTCGSPLTGTRRAAVFRITGVNSPITVTLPSTAILSGPSGSPSLTVTNFTKEVKALGTNKYRIRVGATLNIPGNAQAGVYNGSFSITVNY